MFCWSNTSAPQKLTWHQLLHLSLTPFTFHHCHQKCLYSHLLRVKAIQQKRREKHTCCAQRTFAFTRHKYLFALFLEAHPAQSQCFPEPGDFERYHTSFSFSVKSLEQEILVLHFLSCCLHISAFYLKA